MSRRRETGRVRTSTTTAFVVRAMATRQLRHHVLVTVAGPSMRPTLIEGDRVAVLRTPPDRIRRGDIAVFQDPDQIGAAERPDWLIKRVAAGPGDRVPPALPDLAARFGERVPAGVFAVLSDNHAATMDSRRFGYIRAETVLGVVTCALRRR